MRIHPAGRLPYISSFTVTSGHRCCVELHLLNCRFFVQFIKEEDEKEGNRISIIRYIFGNFFGYQFKFRSIWQQTVHSKLNPSKASRSRLNKTTCFGICISGRQLQMMLLKHFLEATKTNQQKGTKCTICSPPRALLSDQKRAIQIVSTMNPVLCPQA